MLGWLLPYYFSFDQQLSVLVNLNSIAKYSSVSCSLELWYYTAVLILVGFLKNAKLQIDVMSIW
jgi:hypothetical protein